MRWLIYMMYDNKAESTYGPPLVVRNQVEAVRVANDVWADPKTLPGQHPEDFDLYHLGELDDGKPRLTGMEHTTEIILRGDEWLAQQPPKATQLSLLKEGTTNV